MTCERTRLTVSDLIERLKTVPDPDHTPVFASDEAGTITLATGIFDPEKGAWNPQDTLLDNQDLCRVCLQCMPQDFPQDPEQPRPVASKYLCLRTEVAEALATARKLIHTPCNYLTWHEAPHPHAMRNKTGTYVTDANDAFAFTPSAALHATLTKCYPQARDTSRAALHCLELAASLNGWQSADQNPPGLDRKEAHTMVLRIMQAAHNLACNMMPGDWKIIVQDYPET